MVFGAARFSHKRELWRARTVTSLRCVPEHRPQTGSGRTSGAQFDTPQGNVQSIDAAILQAQFNYWAQGKDRVEYFRDTLPACYDIHAGCRVDLRGTEVWGNC
eukprot:970849-Amphidinium_carterae.1